MSDTICPDCGERNARGAEFCSACGGYLAWEGSDAHPEPPQQPPPSSPPPSSPSSSPPPGRQQAASPVAGQPLAGQPQAGQPQAGQAWGQQQPRPTTPVAATGQQVAGQIGGQVAGQAAAQAWNVAAPALGAQLPGALGRGAQAFGAPTSLGGLAQGASLPQGMPWRGSGRNDGQQSPTGSQPTYEQQSPQYDQQQVPAEPPSPIEGPCPRCGVINGPELRFCRKCGLALRGPTLHDGGGPRPVSPPERLPWWRRWFRPADNTRRGARAAYRHSLPVRYRIIRWGLALLGIGAIVGLFAVIGQNPVGWAVNHWNDLLGKTAQVTALEAYTEPDPAAVANPSTAIPSAGATAGVVPPKVQSPVVDTAQNALDNLSNTAWTTPWSAAFQRQPADAPCVSPSSPTEAGGAASILILPPNSINLRKISVAAGLPMDDARRLQQWRPKTLQLAFSNGSCQQVTLEDKDGLQELTLEAVDTSQIRLSVVNAYPPSPDQPIDELAITDLRVFARP